MDFIDLKSEYQLLKDDIQRRIAAVLDSGRYINGPEVAELEQVLAKYVGVKHGIGLGSGTDALYAAVLAYDIKPGDEIITTPFSFFATVEVIQLAGAVPVFADIDPVTYNIDPARVAAAVTPRTRGIIAVSLYGQPADFVPLCTLAAERNLFLHEDACQSFGATQDGRRSCALCHSSSTSFYPSKPLGGYGDGGMLFTDDDAFAEKIRMVRNHGERIRYEHERLGFNGRLDTVQAAILLSKFTLFEKGLAARQQKAAYYNERLADVVTVPRLKPGNTTAVAQYSIRSPRRDALAAHLKAAGVPTAIHYPRPLHQQPAVAAYAAGVSMPVAEAVASEIISLPMSPFLATADQDIVISAIKEFMRK